MTSPLTVVVCSYGRPTRLDLCIEALLAQELQGLGVLVVAVSGDEQTFKVASAWGADFVAQGYAAGIAEARNIGIRAAKTPIVAFVDDDARVRAGWARALVGTLETAGIDGVGGPVFDTRSGEQVVHSWAVDPFGVTHRIVKEADSENMIPTVNGCNMAFRREALIGVGGFDPYYRYYFDETDLCVRLVKSGYRIGFAENAIVDHDFAEGPTRARFVYNSSRTRAYFSLKNFGDSVGSFAIMRSQIRLLREDLRAYIRQRARYPGARGALRACSEAWSGRLRGVLDASTARHESRSPSGDSDRSSSE